MYALGYPPIVTIGLGMDMLLIPFNIIGHAIGYALHGILAKFQFSLHLLNRNIKYSFGFLIVSSLLFSLAYKGCLALVLPSQ
jgi:hypothetical protein